VGLTLLTYFTISIIYDTVDILNPYNQLKYKTLDNDLHNATALYTALDTDNDTLQDIVNLRKDILDNRFLRRKI
jgi:hypothetical protein